MSENRNQVFEMAGKKKKTPEEDPTLELLRKISKKPIPPVVRGESIAPLKEIQENIDAEGKVWKKKTKKKKDK
ncbi:MAG TPA: hypothetical protein VKC53_03490 [Patescibacteria group bacterium]|nr:hypothetical protein [Patescibacteria group bacterium]